MRRGEPSCDAGTPPIRLYPTSGCSSTSATARGDRYAEGAPRIFRQSIMLRAPHTIASAQLPCKCCVNLRLAFCKGLTCCVLQIISSEMLNISDVLRVSASMHTDPVNCPAVLAAAQESSGA